MLLWQYIGTMTPDEVRELQTLAAIDELARAQGVNPDAYALAHAGDSRLPFRAIAEQLDCRRRATTKLPTLGEKLLMERTALEQCSSEATAEFKASLVGGQSLIDITGGLGVDSWAFARMVAQTHYCELDPARLALFEANREALGLSATHVHAGDSIASLSRMPDNSFDWIFADPARRDSSGRHVTLERCQPDIVEHAGLLARTARRLMIKASPLLEPSALTTKLPGLTAWYYVSHAGECRELLMICDPQLGTDTLPECHAVVLDSGGVALHLQTLAFERPDRPPPGPLESYLFEPDPAVIRSGLAPLLAGHNGLHFVNATTAFLTARSPVPGFHGRVIEVRAQLPWRRREVRAYLEQHGVTRATIWRRDFPAAPHELRSMLKVAEGDEHVLVFTPDRRGQPSCIHGMALRSTPPALIREEG